MRELLPLLQSKTQEPQGLGVPGVQDRNRGLEPLAVRELSLREWGEGRRWRRPGSMRWGEFYETAGRWQGAEGIRG